MQSEAEPQKITIYLNNRCVREQTDGLQYAKYNPVPEQQVGAQMY